MNCWCGCWAHVLAFPFPFAFSTIVNCGGRTAALRRQWQGTFAYVRVWREYVTFVCTTTSSLWCHQSRPNINPNHQEEQHPHPHPHHKLQLQPAKLAKFMPCISSGLCLLLLLLLLVVYNLHKTQNEFILKGNFISLPASWSSALSSHPHPRPPSPRQSLHILRPGPACPLSTSCSLHIHGQSKPKPKPNYLDSGWILGPELITSLFLGAKVLIPSQLKWVEMTSSVARQMNFN